MIIMDLGLKPYFNLNYFCKSGIFANTLKQKEAS